jgi:hypothetical protein
LPSTPLQFQVSEIAVNGADGAPATIPANIDAVALNVTVVNPVSDGFLTVYPCDVPRPLASNVNFVAGLVVANGVVAPTSANGEVCVFASTQTDIIVDLVGWFPSEAFTASTPIRKVDSRDGTGSPLAKLTPDLFLSVPMLGTLLTVNGNDAQVPIDATAVALNVTILAPEASGFATV